MGRFLVIAEAYDVLVDPKRRRTFDELGERGLKSPAPGSGIQPYQYVGDPFALFSGFFADANPLTEAVAPAHDGMVPSASEKKAEAAVEVEVVCSAAELQNGTSRRFVVERTRLGPGGVPYQESKPVSLPVWLVRRHACDFLGRRQSHTANKAAGRPCCRHRREAGAQ